MTRQVLGDVTKKSFAYFVRNFLIDDILDEFVMARPREEVPEAEVDRRQVFEVDAFGVKFAGVTLVLP